ncbi:hypothetical protein JCM19233_1836 [Vibrio astriarenae]|nr:hypothetical protein JCM19233_1836 [Vibrio sp. C7]
MVVFQLIFRNRIRKVVLNCRRNLVRKEKGINLDSSGRLKNSLQQYP